MIGRERGIAGLRLTVMGHEAKGTNLGREVLGLSLLMMMGGAATMRQMSSPLGQQVSLLVLLVGGLLAAGSIQVLLAKGTPIRTVVEISDLGVRVEGHRYGIGTRVVLRGSGIQLSDGSDSSLVLVSEADDRDELFDLCVKAIERAGERDGVVPAALEGLTDASR